MMTTFLKIILVLGVCIALVVLVVVGLTLYQFSTKQSDRVVASDVSISADWLELTPQPRLKATKDVQHLIIFSDGDRRSGEETGNEIPRRDRTTGNSEVEIVDETGEVYRLHASLLLSSGTGYRAESSLPQDKSYTRIRIRSDRPFQASQIIWENFNLK